jgi:hypothetical protein
MTSAMVLTEDEALELLAFLVTAARTQLEEAAEYGPLRMLTAAGRLADFIAERASPGTRGLLAGPLKELPDAALRSVDPTKYAAQLDVVCRAVGEHLVSHFGPGPERAVTNAVLEAIRTRRVARSLTTHPSSARWSRRS